MLKGNVGKRPWNSRILKNRRTIENFKLNGKPGQFIIPGYIVKVGPLPENAKKPIYFNH